MKMNEQPQILPKYINENGPIWSFQLSAQLIWFASGANVDLLVSKHTFTLWEPKRNG